MTDQTSAEVVPFDVLKKKIDKRDAPEPAEANPIDGFSPETKADDLANLLISGLYQGLSNSGIDPLMEEYGDQLDTVYELVAEITAHHFDVAPDEGKSNA